MAIRYYDQSLVNKIKNWVNDPELKVLGPDQTSRLFQMKSDIGNDKPLTLPMISLSRDSNIEINWGFNHKKPSSFDGRRLHSSKEYSTQLNEIPITIRYQLDIYTRTAEEADEYVRNFVFNFINYPKLTIEIPYNDSDMEHISNVIIDSTISDNSDIPQRLIQDQFTRWTIRLTIPDAHLFSVPKYDNVSGKLELIELDTGEIEHI